MDWKILLLVIFVAWSLRAALTTAQILDYRKHASELIKDRREGYFASGIAPGWIRSGSIVLLTADGMGTIIRAELMKGRTVFARFNPMTEVVGIHVHDLVDGGPALLADKNTRKALQNAARLIQEKMGSSAQDATAG